MIPFQVSATEYSVFVCLQDENIERMRQYDPAEVTLNKIGFPGKLKDVIIGYGTDEDFERISRALNSGTDVRAVLRTLSRGFRYRPDQGDHDGPYLSARAEKGKPQ
ncbi:MAG: hypothetical protein EPO08_03915 [Rhodospirillaceae bacterium]|nr:MAG: hypothetical protein EPO08_03915 [Rhodospirillaceae bacterium]